MNGLFKVYGKGKVRTVYAVRYDKSSSSTYFLIFDGSRFDWEASYWYEPYED